MSLSQKTLVFFVFLFAILTFLSGILDKKESFLVTELTDLLDTATLTISVTSDSLEGWPDSGFLWIGDEYIRYQSKSTDEDPETPDTFTVWQSGDETGRGYSYGSKETTACSRAAGCIVKAPEADIINTLMGYNTIVVTTNIGDIVGLGLLVWNFIKSLPKMIMWDYSFLEGNLVLVKYLLLYPLSVGFIVTFTMVFTQWARNLLKLI